MLLKETTTHITSKLDHLKVDVSMEPKDPILVGSVEHEPLSPITGWDADIEPRQRNRSYFFCQIKDQFSVEWFSENVDD